MFSLEEMDVIIEEVTHILLKANRSGELEKILCSIGLEEYINKPVYNTSNKGKIVVIGESKVKKEHLIGIGKSLGLEKERFEFCLDYNEAKTYEYKKLRYNPYLYSAVLFGANPHSSTGKGDSSSVISEMQKKEGYPRVEVLRAGERIKITKTNFRETLEKLLKEEIIVA